jgi:protein-L-isoaspartate O-methyltransferase
MLAQLDIRPGQSVLEIGSGGYQAALLRELTGPDGSVTTVDIDSEVTGRARACLDLAGYRDVRTLCADGEHGGPGQGRSTRSSSPCRPRTSRRPGQSSSPRTAGW